MHTITLGGKQRTIKEPVFRQLRALIPLYNRLAVATSDADSGALIRALLAVFFSQPKRLGRVTSVELTAFIDAIPDIAGLKKSDGELKKDGDDWGEIYAHLCAYFNWEYDYVDNHMTLSRLKELEPYMTKNPPTHQLAAAYLGYEGKPKDPIKHFFKSLMASAGVG